VNEFGPLIIQGNLGPLEVNWEVSGLSVVNSFTIAKSRSDSVSLKTFDQLCHVQQIVHAHVMDGQLASLLQQRLERSIWMTKRCSQKRICYICHKGLCS